MSLSREGIQLQQGHQGFIWFTGVVEKIDNDSKDKLFNVLVRVIGEHDSGVATAQLVECQPLLTSGSAGGASDTPIYYPGTKVVGFWRDAYEKQYGVIIGAYPIIPGGDENKHSIHWNAREKNIIEKPKEYRPEFDSSYKAKYPFNRVIATRPDANGRAHVIEIDDTPGEERLHVYHKAGTYIEINKDGRVVIKCVNDSYELVNGNKELYVKGDYTVKAEGSISILSTKGNVDVTSADGNVVLSSGRKTLVQAGDGMTITAATEVAVKSPGGLVCTDGSILCYGPVVSLTSTGDFTTDGEDIQYSILGPGMKA